MQLARLLVCASLLAPAALAGGLDARRLPADTRWVTHVDLEALDRSAFLRALAERGEDFTREFDLDEVQPAFGVDPRKDLTGLTFFNATKKDGDYTVIAEARASAEEHWARLIEKSAGSRALGKRDIYVLGGTSGLLATRASAAGVEPRLYVLATSDAGLAAALAVLDGEAQSASSSRATVIPLRPTAGAIVFASGSSEARTSWFLGRGLQLLAEFAALQREESTTLARNTRGLVFEIGEEGKELWARLELESRAPEEAEETARVLRTGVARVVQLASRTDAIPQVERLTQALHFEAEAARLRATFRYDAAAFVDDVLRAEELMGVRKPR